MTDRIPYPREGLKLTVTMRLQLICSLARLATPALVHGGEVDRRRPVTLRRGNKVERLRVKSDDPIRASRG
jgi:hypothetical protein